MTGLRAASQEMARGVGVGWGELWATEASCWHPEQNSSTLTCFLPLLDHKQQSLSMKGKKKTT